MSSEQDEQTGLICIECGIDTGIGADVMDDKPVEIAVAIACEWRCNECLDAAAKTGGAA